MNQHISRLAKLLRMLTSSHEGEVLAAANRINAIIAAHELDWDQLLIGQHLTEEQMQRLYWEGYERGKNEAIQAQEPDWPTPNTSVEAILRAFDSLDTDSREYNQLSNFEIEFLESMSSRYRRFHNRLYLSDKQLAVFDRIERKFRRLNLLQGE